MKTITHNFLFFLALVLLVLLPACNRPTGEITGNPTLNVTQAYETVAARLTQGIVESAQAPTATIQPTAEASPAVTATASETDQAALSTPGSSPTITLTPTSQQRCDQAAPGYPSIDITIEDDTILNPGEAFTKVWRLVNHGSCTWDNQYAAVWFSGEQMSANQVISLPARVEPGQSIDISVDMVAPQTNGTYQSNWKLRNPQGQYFGIGPDGVSAFWVRIVIDAQTTATPTPTLAPSATAVSQVGGPVTLAISDTLDLDNLQLNTGGGDLNYIRSEQGEDSYLHQLLPIANSLLAISGSQQPTLAGCQSAALGAQPVTIEELANGIYLCYRTNQGLPGWLRLDAFDPQSGNLSVTILTWALP